jgi:hypothetical protein
LDRLRYSEFSPNRHADKAADACHDSDAPRIAQEQRGTACGLRNSASVGSGTWLCASAVADAMRLDDGVRNADIGLPKALRGARGAVARENIVIIDQPRAANHELALQITRRIDAEQQQMQ